MAGQVSLAGGRAVICLFGIYCTPSCCLVNNIPFIVCSQKKYKTGEAECAVLDYWAVGAVALIEK